MDFPMLLVKMFRFVFRFIVLPVWVELWFAKMFFVGFRRTQIDNGELVAVRVRKSEGYSVVRVQFPLGEDCVVLGKNSHGQYNVLMLVLNPNAVKDDHSDECLFRAETERLSFEDISKMSSSQDIPLHCRCSGIAQEENFPRLQSALKLAIEKIQ